MSQLLNSYDNRPTAATLAGVIAVTFGGEGVMTELELAGAASMNFGAFGDLRIQKVIAGNARMTFGQSATLQPGVIPMVGTAAMTFGQSATLQAVAGLSGSAGMTFGDGATLRKGAQMEGTASMTFDKTGTLRKAAKMAGSAAMNFGQSAEAFVATMPSELPVAWWDLEEASANVASGLDSAGRGHHLAILYDPVGSDTGVVGFGAVSGEDDESTMSVDDHVDFRSSAAFTIAGWFKVGGIASPARTELFAKWGDYVCIYDEANDRLEFTAGGVTAFVACPPTNTWFFLVCQCDGTNISVRVNAGTPGTASGRSYSAGVEFRLFSNTATHNSAYADSVGIWQEVLSFEEILWLYNTGSGRAFSDFG